MDGSGGAAPANTVFMGWAGLGGVGVLITDGCWLLAGAGEGDLPKATLGSGGAVVDGCVGFFPEAADGPSGSSRRPFWLCATMTLSSFTLRCVALIRCMMCWRSSSRSCSRCRLPESEANAWLCAGCPACPTRTVPFPAAGVCRWAGCFERPLDPAVARMEGAAAVRNASASCSRSSLSRASAADSPECDMLNSWRLAMLVL